MSLLCYPQDPLDIWCQILMTEEELCKGIKERIQADYGVEVDSNDVVQIPKLLESLSRLPHLLVRVCGIKSLGFKDQGVSKEYYPNHGYYVADQLVLNTQLLDDPQVFIDHSGRTLDRFEHTLYHEMGHGFDEHQKDAALQPDWLELSGWSKDPHPGLLRVTINEDGSPELVGDWWYSPSAVFPRFYAKRSPWEDYADCFSFYVGGLKDFLPASKISYFDNVLKDYIEGL